MFDYHVHSDFSVDCVVPMADSCEAAVRAGITEIAFTDHVDHQSTDPGYGYYRPDAYLDAIATMRARFDGRLTILAGAEVDYHDDTRSDVDRFLSTYGHRYDVVIGSVHYGRNAQIIFPEYFTGKTVDDVVFQYLDQVQRAIETGWFDTIGHLDIPKRYLPSTLRTYDPLRYRTRLGPIFEALQSRDMCFEINTSGLRQAPKTSMPGPAIVRWWADAGGEFVTTGSDSHAAQTVGAGLPTTLAMLELCGIEKVATFRSRVRSLSPVASLDRAAVSAHS